MRAKLHHYRSPLSLHLPWPAVVSGPRYLIHLLKSDTALPGLGCMGEWLMSSSASFRNLRRYRIYKLNLLLANLQTKSGGGGGGFEVVPGSAARGRPGYAQALVWTTARPTEQFSEAVGMTHRCQQQLCLLRPGTDPMPMLSGQLQDPTSHPQAALKIRTRPLKKASTNR